MTFIPSEEQQSILDATTNTSNNLAIAALAGTGKTTTLVELSKCLPDNGSKLFCAFNKAIVEELERRLPNNVNVSTFHSLGFAALKRYVGMTNMRPNNAKYRAIIREWEKNNDELHYVIEQIASKQKTINARQFYSDLCNETRNFAFDVLNWTRYKLINWYDGAALASLISRYGMAEDVLYDPDIIRLLIQDVATMMNLAEQQTRAGEIDFTDMIYWPVYWNASVDQYTYVMVDEVQDLSPMQRELVDMALESQGRIFIVGDKHQAIYAFAGADADSFDLSVEKWKTTVLPLTVTRRCSKTVTSHAAEVVSTFTCPPMTEPGAVLWVDESQLFGVVQPGDMILCRMRAPLVDTVLDLIGANIPATILGSDIGKQLVKIIDTLLKRNDWNFAHVKELIIRYQEEQVEYSLNKGNEDKAERVKDECAALLTILSRTKPRDEVEFRYAVEGLFSEQKNNGRIVLLSTIHKVKGMEADRVFILKPEKIGELRAGHDDQEVNLDYVARTRAKTVLVYLTNRKYLQAVTKPAYVTVTVEKEAVIALPAPNNQYELPLVSKTVKEQVIEIVKTMNDDDLEALLELLSERTPA